MRYKDYKKVDLPWLSEVPSHWGIVRAKSYIASIKALNKDRSVNNVLSLTLKGVIRNNKEKPIGLSPSDYSTYQIFDRNNLVFKLIDLNNTSTSRVGLVDETGIMSSAYIRGIIDEKKLYPKYIFYWYFKLYVEEVYNQLGSGVRSTITSQELFNLEIPLPPKEEQEQIARFLDWKISEIDRLIEIKKKQIDIIETIRRSLIINLLLYNNNSPKVMLARCVSENKKKNTDNNQNLLSLSYGKIVRKNIDTTFGLLPEKFDKYQVVDKGDIILRLTDLQNDHKSLRVGLVEENGIITSAYIGLLCNKNVVPEYLYSYLNAMDLRKDFYSMGAGVRQNLNYSELKKVIINLPEKNEQKMIAKMIKDKDYFINKAKVSLQSQIEKLQLLKQSLISDAVTGRIDVRNMAIPDFKRFENEDREEVDEILEKEEV